MRAPRATAAHGVRGDSRLVAVATGLIRRGVTVHAGAVLGGGPAGFDDDRIATAALFEVLDAGSRRYQGDRAGRPGGRGVLSSVADELTPSGSLHHTGGVILTPLGR